MTVPWLDHACAMALHMHILSCETLDAITIGDHLPVQIVLMYSCSHLFGDFDAASHVIIGNVGIFGEVRIMSRINDG